MNKNIKIKLTIAITILSIFICVISAGWVIAQSAKGSADKNAAGEKPSSASSGPCAAAPAAPAPKIDMPQKTSKFFGQTGRPDPFIVVTGTSAKMSLPSTGQSSTGQVKSGQGGTEGYAGGVVLTGTFIVNGKKYALIKFGDKTQICQVGTQIMGFKVTKISSKKVTLISKTGTIELKIGDYLMKNQSSNNMQTPSSFGGENKSLVPPPMQAPAQMQTEAPGSSNAPAAEQHAPAESYQQGAAK